MQIRMRLTVTWSKMMHFSAITAMIGLLLAAVDCRLSPFAPDWQHRLTEDALAAYVNQTFGPHQQCLKVASDDTTEAASIVAMLYHPRRPRVWDGGSQSDYKDSYGVSVATAVTRTIELVELWNDPSTTEVLSCPAFVIVGRRLDVVKRHMENFRKATTERVLMVVLQRRKYIKPFTKVRSSRKTNDLSCEIVTLNKF